MIASVYLIAAVYASSLLFSQGASAQAPRNPAADVEYASGQFVNPQALGRTSVDDAIDGGPVSLRFNEAEVSVIIEDVVGEVLGLDYTIASDVRGRLTLRMSDMTSRREILRQLRTAFTAINVAMVDRGDFIAFVRGGAGGQVGTVSIIEAGQPVDAGASVAALQLRFAAPTQVAPLIAAMNTSVEVRLADDLRRLLVISGEPAAMTAASESASVLDVDYLDRISSGIFQLAHVEPALLVGELQQLVRLPEDVVEYVAIDRLSVLVVFAASPETIDRIGAWVVRLDQSPVLSQAPGRRVYRVRHTDPGELVEALYSVMGTGTGPERSAATRGNRDEARSEDPIDRVLIGAAPDQNIVLLRGSESDVDLIAGMLELLDTPRPQVLIQAVIAEVTLTEETRFGIDWSALESDHLALAFGGTSSATPEARFPGLSAVYLNTDFNAALNALSLQSELEVISRPSVLTLHNEQAELQIGDQVPVVVQSAVSVTDPGAPLVNQTAYRDTGILLTVTPQIRSGGLVEIEINQEVSGVLQTTSSGIDSPTITQRRLTSRLLVPSGEAVALGGLISSRRTDSVTGVPVLRRLPVIGRAFRSEGRTQDRTELIILLTPTIIADPVNIEMGLQALPDALERLRQRVAER